MGGSTSNHGSDFGGILTDGTVYIHICVRRVTCRANTTPVSFRRRCQRTPIYAYDEIDGPPDSRSNTKTQPRFVGCNRFRRRRKRYDRSFRGVTAKFSLKETTNFRLTRARERRENRSTGAPLSDFRTKDETVENAKVVEINFCQTKRNRARGLIELIFRRGIRHGGRLYPKRVPKCSEADPLNSRALIVNIGCVGGGGYAVKNRFCVHDPNGIYAAVTGRPGWPKVIAYAVSPPRVFQPFFFVSRRDSRVFSLLDRIRFAPFYVNRRNVYNSDVC